MQKDTTQNKVSKMVQKRLAYAEFEKTIVDLYEQQRLTLKQLDDIASQYRLRAIDTAGSQYLLARDGKDVQQICIALIDPTFPLAERGSHKDHEEFWYGELKRWEAIVRSRWGWRAYGAVFPNQAADEEWPGWRMEKSIAV